MKGNETELLSFTLSGNVFALSSVCKHNLLADELYKGALYLN